MTAPMNVSKKSTSPVRQVLIGFILGGVAILVLSAVAREGYRFGKDPRAQHEREAANDVRQGD